MRPYLKGDFWATVWIHQMKLVTKVGLGLGHIVLDGNPAPPSSKGHSPQFTAHICCGQMAGWDKMLLGMEVGLSPDDIVLDGYPAPPSPKRESPQFSAHVYSGQTAAWIKMALGTDVGLGPVHIVLDGDTASLRNKRAEPPIFGPSLLWPNNWMHQGATCFGGRPQPRRLC